MDRINRFLERYEAQARTSQLRYARRRPMSWSEFNCTATQAYESYIDHEPYVEVQIPQGRLHELAERDHYYSQLDREHEYTRVLIDKMAQDERVRKTNPAVEKAWRNYQVLLELARTSHD